MAEEGYWFCQKRFGWGITPATWQGWVLTLAFAAAVFLAARIIPKGPVKPLAMAGLFAVYVVIVARKTSGRWRWGRQD